MPATVYIGKKDFMHYVTAAVMQFMQEGEDQVTIAGRGNKVNKAIRVAKTVEDFFLPNMVSEETTTTEMQNLENKAGKDTFVSEVEIELTRTV